MEYSSGSICFDLSELPFLETVKWVVKKHIHKRPPCDGWQPLLRVKPFPAPLPLLEAQLMGRWNKLPRGAVSGGCTRPLPRTAPALLLTPAQGTPPPPAPGRDCLGAGDIQLPWGHPWVLPQDLRGS